MQRHASQRRGFWDDTEKSLQVTQVSLLIQAAHLRVLRSP